MFWVDGYLGNENELLQGLHPLIQIIQGEDGAGYPIPHLQITHNTGFEAANSDMSSLLGVLIRGVPPINIIPG